MKQTLSLKLGQQLTMTPQLQQAIRLLQLSSLDLQQEIQAALESNPMLELDEETEGLAEEELEGLEREPVEEPAAEAYDDDLDDAERAELNGEGLDSFDAVDPEYEGETIATAADPDDGAWDQPIPEDLPVDTQWDDIYQGSSTSAGPAPEEDWDLDSRNSAAESLRDHLMWQLNLTPMSDVDRVIATCIIDAIDPDGMLSVPVEEIAESCGPFEDESQVIEVDEVVAVLKRIQQFDPVGVGARNLAECLALQLKQLPADTPWLDTALVLVEQHLDLLGARDFAALKRKLKLSESELAQVVQLIQSLNPRPGSSVASEPPEYVVPDVLVTRKNGRWHVELNAEATPRLKINDTYANLVRRADNSTDNTFLRDNLQEARWFLKSLQSRNETLLKVATKIVEHQRGFLEYGEEAMKPLVLHDIAEAVDMHESTISRVTNRKYMHTPRGIFELKYFFSSHVSTASGGEVSSTAIRALIKKLTAEENPRKPLSDNKIAAILADQNINVARRTVAKYRESMSIPPSNERKRL
ncbi:MAG TPA: RNA polymerase factor sigma-54, partial [Pseudomonadales bacterium]